MVNVGPILVTFNAIVSSVSDLTSSDTKFRLSKREDFTDRNETKINWIMFRTELQPENYLLLFTTVAMAYNIVILLLYCNKTDNS